MVLAAAGAVRAACARPRCGGGEGALLCRVPPTLPARSRPGTLSLPLPPPPLAPKREFPGSAEKSRSTAQPLAQRAPSAETVAGTPSSPNRLSSFTGKKAPSRSPVAGYRYRNGEKSLPLPHPQPRGPGRDKSGGSGEGEGR